MNQRPFCASASGEQATGRRKDPAQKLLKVEQLLQLAAVHRVCGQTLVFTNGCFDLFHIGHLTSLRQAAAQGDILVVALNSDRSICEIKGPGRPVVDQNARAACVAALECVNYVIVFDEPTPEKLLRRLRPDVLVKGGDYGMRDIVGRGIVESYGGRVKLTQYIEGISTTQILHGMASNGSGR